MRSSSTSTSQLELVQDHWIIIEAAGTFAAFDINRFKRLAHAEVPYNSSPLPLVGERFSINHFGVPKTLPAELKSMLDNHWQYIALRLSDADGERKDISRILLKDLVEDLMVPKTSPGGNVRNTTQPICPFRIRGPEGELCLSVNVTEVPHSIFQRLAREQDGAWYIHLGVTIGRANVARLAGPVELYANQLFLYCLSAIITITSVCRFIATYNKLGGDPESVWLPHRCEHPAQDNNHVCVTCRRPRPCAEVTEVMDEMYCQDCLNAPVAHLGAARVSNESSGCSLISETESYDLPELESVDRRVKGTRSRAVGEPAGKA